MQMQMGPLMDNNLQSSHLEEKTFNGLGAGERDQRREKASGGLIPRISLLIVE